MPACFTFSSFRKRPFPADFEKPQKTLKEYMDTQNKYVPGIRNE